MLRRILIAAAVAALLVLPASEMIAPAVAAAAAVADPAATAQPLGSTYVDLSPLVALLRQIAEGVVAIIGPAVLAAAFSWFRQKTGVAVSQDAQQVVERAFNNGINLATTRLQTLYGGKLTLDVHNQLAATVVNYVIDHAGPELKKLGIDPEKNAENLAEKAIARLAGAGIVPSATGSIEVRVPAVPSAPAVGLLSGPGVAPLRAA
jgi:hypothetical protein